MNRGHKADVEAKGLRGSKRFVRERDWLLMRVERVRRAFGLLLRPLGVAILTGGDKWLEAQVLRVLPDASMNLTVGI